MSRVIHVPSGRSPQARMTCAKCLVKGDLKLAGTDRACEAAGDVHAGADVEDGTRIGGPPQDRVAFAEPREYALGVGPQSGKTGSSDPPTPTSPLSSAYAGGIHGTSASRSQDFTCQVSPGASWRPPRPCCPGYFSMISFSVVLALSVCFRLICSFALVSNSAAALSPSVVFGLFLGLLLGLRIVLLGDFLWPRPVPSL